MVPRKFDYFVCTAIKEDWCLIWATHNLRQNVSLFFDKKKLKGGEKVKAWTDN